jgi:uncharacterized membrane protein YpjA
VYVSMFWVKLNDLMDGYFGILKKKKKSLVKFALSN